MIKRLEDDPLIELAKEQVFPISQGYKGPKRRGGGTMIYPSTLRGWALKGLRAPDGELVRLDLIAFGGTLCTSVEAIQRFCERLTPSPKAPSLSPTPARRNRADERAAEQCKRFGL